MRHFNRYAGESAEPGIHRRELQDDKATDDFRHATELKANNVFDVLAQNASQQKIKQLSKQLPCGNDTHVTANSQCL